MTQTIWSPQAADDLTEALDYLLERNPQAAAKLASRRHRSSAPRWARRSVAMSLTATRQFGLRPSASQTLPMAPVPISPIKWR
jgi:hypothetical protein